MNLPSSFIHTIHHSFGDRGRLFLESLPSLVDEAAGRWQLTDLQPAANLSYNFVAFANRLGQAVVLKLGVPGPELTSQITSLRLFDGRGAVRLLESDAERGMLLLEYLRPGKMLVTVADDAQATRVAADLMLSLRGPASSDPGLILLREWFKELERLRPRVQGGAGPLDSVLVERAQAAVRDFFSENYQPALIYGDLHHFNILSSERGWLAIDPKGVIGPSAYEVGPYLVNPWVVTGATAEMSRLIKSCIAILSEYLGLEKKRVRAWGLAHAVLSAFWSWMEGGDWRPAMECASVLGKARR